MNSSVKFKCFNKTIMLLTKHVYEELIDSLFAKSSNTHLRTVASSPHRGWEDKQHQEYCQKGK